jgi:hypothetical protein
MSPDTSNPKDQKQEDSTKPINRIPLHQYNNANTTGSLLRSFPCPETQVSSQPTPAN